MENEMTLEATHDGTGHVQIAVTLRQAQRAHAPDAWSARIVLTLEAGEQLREIASTAGHFRRPPIPLNSARLTGHSRTGTAPALATTNRIRSHKADLARRASARSPP
jgi:hypothetical protein